MLSPHLAKCRGVAWERTAFIPQDSQRLTQRPAPIYDGSNLQIVPVRSEGGRNDGYPVPGFSESQEGMWGAGFEPNVGY
jgi:hypothetical protein